MTLSRRSFLGRGLALVGGAVAAVKLGGAPKRAEAVSTTADLAALQQAERDAHPLYAVTVKPAPTSVVMTDFLEGVCASYRSGWEASFLGLLGGDEVSGAGAPYTHTFRPQYVRVNIREQLRNVTFDPQLGAAPRMRDWYRPNASSQRQSDLTANYSDLIADYGVPARPPFDRATLSEPSPRRHARLLFAEPRHVKRRG